MHVVIGTVHFEPRVRDDLFSELTALTSNSRREPGCLGYWFAEDVEEPGTLRFFACWQDDATFEAHRHVQHLLDYQEFTSAHRSEIRVVDTTRYEISDVANM